MASSVNKVILVGRLGKNPEVRFTQGGQAVANFSIATDESYTDREGQKQKKVEWHNIVVWGKSVEAFVQPYIHKGDMVYVEGKLQTRSWEKDGVTKYTTEINVTDIKGLITTPVDAQPQQQRTASRPPAGRPQTQSRPPASRPPAGSPAPQQEVSDEDIPF